MNSQTQPTSPLPLSGSAARRPTHIRWHMMAMLTLISALTYLDRLNLSVAGHYIQTEYSLSTESMGWILSGFVLGYALFQIPGGWAGDRFGPRNILTFAIVWWSVFTAATPLAPSLPLVRWFGLAVSFFAVRFLIGMGEASAFPNANKIVAFWMGQDARGAGNSLFLMGVGVGGVSAPMLIAWFMQRWGWRASFYVCGALGLVVAALWHSYATDRPEEHPRVNRAELEFLRLKNVEVSDARGSHPARVRSVPWARLLSQPSTWFLMLSYFCEGYPNYIFYTWFFIYLVQVRGLTVSQGGRWGTTPFLAIVLLAPLGGWLSDRAISRLGRRRGRQSVACAGMIASAVLLSAGAHTANNAAAIILMAGAMGFNMFATPTWWAACIDISPNYSGSLSAMMNACGNLGGWISPILTAYIATQVGWTAALDFAAVITFVGAILWLGVKADRNLESPWRESPSAEFA